MIVADASAIVKLVIHEPESELVFNKFQSFSDDEETIYSPEITLTESLNVIWKHHLLLKDLSKNDLKTAIGALFAVWAKINKVNSEPISKYAISIAIDYKISVYDSLYLSYCKLNYGKLFTFDHELAKAAKLLGVQTIKI